jgi:hypothetical protein
MCLVHPHTIHVSFWGLVLFYVKISHPLAKLSQALHFTELWITLSMKYHSCDFTTGPNILILQIMHILKFVLVTLHPRNIPHSSQTENFNLSLNFFCNFCVCDIAKWLYIHATCLVYLFYHKSHSYRCIFL